jgi:hypothetical protein
MLYRTTISSVRVYLDFDPITESAAIRNNSEQCEECGQEVRGIRMVACRPCYMQCDGDSDHPTGCTRNYPLELVNTEDREE